MALAAATLTMPTLASAQDRGNRGEWRGGGEGRGGQGNQNRGDRMAQIQQRPAQQQNPQPQAPQPQAQVQQAPPVAQQQAPRADRGQRYQGQAGQAYRGRARGAGDQRGWTDAQREAYRGAVLEGRATDQFQNRGGVRQPDRQGDRNGDGRAPGQWQGGRSNDRGGNWNGGDRRGDRNNSWQNDRGGSYGRESWRNNGGRDNRSWDRGWRGNDHYNWSSYRSSNRNIFSGGRYYSPYRNYSYRRLGIGFSLGSLFYGSQYWINDPYYYRLPEAYGPYRWVRYYDDVLLVDTYTGEVVDAIYDFFY
jgi:hypothetical protein